MTEQVKDRTGKVINPGDRVLVFQEEDTRKATVHEVFPNLPTRTQPGHWVDLEIDDDFSHGLEGVMSYILEVIDE